MIDPAHVVSVNVAQPREVLFGTQCVKTGIFKEPVEGPVRVTRLGLVGDGQADLSVHGGVDKAVYAYSSIDIAHFREALARDDLVPGTFGENLTLDGVTDDAVALGEVLRIGGAVLQITQPRQPCSKLASKLGLPGFPKQFTKSGRTGFYLRVLEEGPVRAGDTIARVDRDADAPTVRALNAALMLGVDAASVLPRALRNPALSQAWREVIERRLARG